MRRPASAGRPHGTRGGHVALEGREKGRLPARDAVLALKEDMAAVERPRAWPPPEGVRLPLCRRAVAPAVEARRNERKLILLPRSPRNGVPAESVVPAVEARRSERRLAMLLRSPRDCMPAESSEEVRRNASVEFPVRSRAAPFLWLSFLGVERRTSSGSTLSARARSLAEAAA